MLRQHGSIGAAFAAVKASLFIQGKLHTTAGSEHEHEPR